MGTEIVWSDDTCITCGCKLGDEFGEKFFDDDGGPLVEGPFCETCYLYHQKEVLG